MQLRATRLTAIAHAVRKLLFTPASLFTSGAPGAWYDPSDMTTLYQDAAGTTPVTAVEQPVGLMKDKSGRGNHAFQTTAASRPVLRARYNQIVGSNGFTGAIITPATGIVVVATGLQDPRGEFTARQIRNSTTTEQHRLYYSVTSAGRNKYSVEVKNVDAGFVQLSLAGTVVAASGVTFNLSTRTYTLVGATLPTASVEALPNGFLRLTVIAPANETQTNNVQLYVLESDPGSVNPSTTGTAKSVIVAGADLRVLNDALNQPAYQRVNTSTDYDTVGFKPYLLADGVDDGMVTNSINFTATDKMTVCTGVRKFSDAAIGIFAELSNDANSNNGTFFVAAPVGATTGNYGVKVRGNISALAAGYAPAPFTSPITNVVSASLNLSGSTKAQVIIPRINGVLRQGDPDANTLNNGGNFGNYPLYLFRRGGTTLPFNGRFYGMTVAGKALTDGELASLEAYTNSKTGAY